MNPTKTQNQLNLLSPAFFEFVLVLALFMSLSAFSIDGILPALGAIQVAFGLDSINTAQYVITALFLGMTAGQVFMGPLSDSYGRKPVIYFGCFLFIIGSLCSAQATSFTYILLGRLLQGFGVSAPRVITTAIIRDRFQGKLMAQVMSTIIGVFVFMPMVAPFVGKFIMELSNWRYIFYWFILMAFVACFWLYFRVPETQPPEQRKPFTFRAILDSVKLTLSSRSTVLYTITQGLVFAGLVGYLNGALIIFQDIYHVGDQYPIYFALTALPIAGSSFLNTWLVEQCPIRKLVFWGCLFNTVLATVPLLYTSFSHQEPFLWATVLTISSIFFFIGVNMSNTNALAMEPLGSVAGTASAFISSLSTLIAALIGAFIGQLITTSVTPLFLGFALTQACACLIVKQESQHQE